MLVEDRLQFVFQCPVSLCEDEVEEPLVRQRPVEVFRSKVRVMTCQKLWQGDLKTIKSYMSHLSLCPEVTIGHQLRYFG